MGIKYKTIKDEFPEMIKRMESLNGRKVEVGVLEGENAWLASIHEYGCNIPVTPKMRAFLHYHGLHLSKDTKVIRIPERSFLRTGYDENVDDVTKRAGMLIAQVLDGSISDDELLNEVGRTLSTKIKEYAVDLSSPPNSSYTVEQKGSSNPLVDSGSMIEGITWRNK